MRTSFEMYAGDNRYTASQQTYSPLANMRNIAQQNALTNPYQIGNINVVPLSPTSNLNANAGNIQNYYNYDNLHNDIYSGIKTAVNQERELAQARLNNTMANAGLFRSGLTVANQQQLERNAIDALAKGWGETAYNVAQLQGNLASQQAQLDTNVNLRNAELNTDLAKTQAALTFDISKYNADIQNAFTTKNYEYLMNAAAQDQEAINQASQFNIQIKNAYDEMAYKWMASLLDQEIREYQYTIDALAREQQATLQYGDAAAKRKLADLNIGSTYYKKLFTYGDAAAKQKLPALDIGFPYYIRLFG